MRLLVLQLGLLAATGILLSDDELHGRLLNSSSAAMILIKRDMLQEVVARVQRAAAGSLQEVDRAPLQGVS